MRILLSLLFYFLLLFSTHAQTLTKEQALGLAQDLQDIKILSEKGKQYLLTLIEDNKLPSYSSQLGLTKIAFLNFLGQAFAGDHFYRSGLSEQMRLQKEYGLDQPYNAILKEDRQLSEEELEAVILQRQKEQEANYLELSKILEEHMKNFKGHQIEEKIEEEPWPFEDSTISFSWHLNSSLSAFPKVELIHEERSVLGKTRTRTLTDLLKLGFIDQKVYEDAVAALQNREIFWEYSVIQFCLQRIYFYDNYEQEKQQQFQWLNQLQRAHLISKKSLNTIKKSYQPWQLQNRFDWLPYCKNALTFDLHQYPADPLQAYPLFFEKIKTIVPDFDYKNLTIKQLEDKEHYTDLTEVKLQISFELDGRKYAHLQFYDFAKEGEEPDSLVNVSNGIQAIVNKVLLERNAKERLYYANKRGLHAAYCEQAFGLILLTQQQYKAWGGFDPFFLSQENHDNSLNSANFQKILKGLTQLGLFDHLTAAEIQTAEQQLANSSIDTYKGFLNFFPRTIVYFDWETGNLENPYEELTQELGAISRGSFTPTNIVDEFEKSWEKATTLFAFEFKGKKYEAQLSMDRDWLDPQFMTLIEQALQENQVDGAYYIYLSDGQATGYIFLTKEQHSTLEKKYPKLLEDEY